MDDDTRLGAVLHRAVSTLEPPTERLVAGALARGRRRRRLLVIGQALTGAAVLAGVAALTLALVPGSSSDAGRVVPAGPVSTASAPLTKPGTVPMTPQALLQTAIDTLPRAGHTSNYDGNFSTGGASTQFVYDDGHGAAQIYVSMDLVPADNGEGSPCSAGSDGCSVLPDGAHAQFRSSKEYTDGRTPNTTNWVLNLVRADGVQIDIYEFNAPQEKDAALTRAEPPFSSAELIKWADSPKFTAQISPAYAKATSTLFKGTDLSAEPTAPKQEAATQARKGAERAQQEHNCELAKKIHKTPPSYCH